jgi:selenium metabolism protein YedF
VKTKNALDAGGDQVFNVIVDNPVAVENVCRFAGREGCVTTVEERDGAHHITVSRVFPHQAREPAHQAKIVAYLNSSRVGVGDDKLGEILMRAFIKTLKEVRPLPAKVIFLNSGVFLTTEGSFLIDDLKELEQMSVGIHSCGTCLDYFHLTDKLKVGVISNMFDIVEALAGADRVLRP